MSTVAEFIKWDDGCRFHSRNMSETGLRGWHFDYNQPYPCPNGLPVDTRSPSECEEWRTRVAEAIQFMKRHSAEIDVREMAQNIPEEKIVDDIKEIKAWLTLPLLHPSAGG